MIISVFTLSSSGKYSLFRKFSSTYAFVKQHVHVLCRTQYDFNWIINFVKVDWRHISLSSPTCKFCKVGTKSVSFFMHRPSIIYWDIVHLVKAMAFSVIMCGCESWTIKKAERWRIDAFELWCWRRFLRVPWTARRSVKPKGNQPWIFIGRTDADAGVPVLRAPVAKTDSLEKTLMLGKIEGRRRREWQGMKWLRLHHQLNGHEFEQILGDNEGPGILAWCSTKSQTQLNNNKWKI